MTWLVPSWEVNPPLWAHVYYLLCKYMPYWCTDEGKEGANSFSSKLFQFFQLINDPICPKLHFQYIKRWLALSPITLFQKVWIMFTCRGICGRNLWYIPDFCRGFSAHMLRIQQQFWMWMCPISIRGDSASCHFKSVLEKICDVVHSVIYSADSHWK